MAEMNVMEDWKTQPKKPDDVSGEIAKVIDKGGPLMKRAETMGFQAANRRGLLNSSMAVGAAQDAVLDRAIPIGSQQASQNFQSNETSGQRGFDATQRGLDRSLQERIASWNIDTDERKAAAGLLAQLEAAYAQQYAGIMANTRVDATARQKLVDNLSADRSNRINLIEQMFNIDLNWIGGPSAPTGGGTPAAPAPTPGGSPARSPAPRPATPREGNSGDNRGGSSGPSRGDYGGSWGGVGASPGGLY